MFPANPTALNRAPIPIHIRRGRVPESGREGGSGREGYVGNNCV